MASQKLFIDIVARDKATKALTGLQAGLAKVRGAVFNLKNAFIGLGAGIVIKGFVDAGIQIEALEVQLKALFGSAKEGQKALEAVTKFAATTPFELKNIQQGITALATVRKQAEANGVSFEELLKITGNTATLLGNDFALASLQVQRSFSAGISSAELFRERGIKAMAGFKEGVSINTKESIKGLSKAFGTGGEFGNLMDELALTLFGTISNLKDAFFIFQVEVSKGFFTALKNNLGDLKKTVEENREEIADFGRMIGSGLSAIIETTAKTLKLLKDNAKLLSEAFRIFIAMKVVGFFHNLAIAIGVANGAMIGFNATVRKNLFIGGAVILLSQLDRVIEAIKKLINKLKEAFGLFKKIGIAVEGVEHHSKGLQINSGKIEKLSEAIKRNFLSIFSSLEDANKGSLQEMLGKITSIGITIGKGLNKGIKSFSDALAESIVLGKDLQETMQKLAQSIMVKLLSFTIELILRKQIELILEKRKTKEMKTQLGLQAAMAAFSFASGGFKLPFFNKGGSVRKGQPVIVGDSASGRGGELFVPNSSGQIIPNSRLGSMGRGVNVNFNINTVDATGFEELLVNSRGTISQLINQALNEKGQGNLI